MAGLCVLLVLAVIVKTGSGQVGFSCCSPKVWNSNVRSLRVFVDEAGAIRRQVTWQRVSYDANNKRVSVFTFRDNDRALYLRQVLDYAKRERYIIEGEQQQKCVRHPLTRPFQSACVPGNTTSVYFARVGDTTSTPTSPGLWENTAYFSQDDVTGYATVTLVDCAMVAEVAYGELDRDSVALNIQYMNQTLNRVDPAVFHIPPGCVNDPVEIREEPWQQFSVLGKLI